MKKIKTFKNWVTIILLLSFSYSHAQNSTENKNDNLTLPPGFSATIVTESVGKGRHIVVNTNGDIYVSLLMLKNKNGIVALRDTNHDGKADIIKYFGTFSGTGIGIRDGYLYFSSDTMFVRYKIQPGELLPDPKYEIVAKGFHINHQHGAKSFTFDNVGNLYVNVGAPSNACQSPE